MQKVIQFEYNRPVHLIQNYTNGRVYYKYIAREELNVQVHV